MKAVLKLILATVPAGLMTAIVWLWGNSFRKQNGVGFLERQGWPVNDIYSCSGIAVGLAILSMIVFRFWTERRRQQLEATGAMLGLNFRELVSRNQLGIQGRLPLFDDWDEGRNLLEGSVDGIPLQLFDYTSVNRSTSAGNRNGQNRNQQSVIVIPFSDRGGVSFSVRRQNSLLSINRLLGFDGLSFEGTGVLSEEEQDQLRRFNEGYLVMHLNGRASDSAGLGNDEKNTQIIAQQTSISLLKKLVDGRGWSFDACESHVAFWIDRKRFRPDQVPQLINESLELFRELSLGHHDGPGLRMTGQPDISTTVDFNRLGPVILSGCLGMVLAFGLFVPIFFIFADRAPWLVFVWPFFGMAVIAVSVILGSKIARRKP